MKVVTDSNEVIDLGVTETAPTISITDYSRRVTDDFGVTTVVPRKFARRLSVRMLLATSAVDAVQRRLAGLRATPANWVADESLSWLAVRGFFKDFEIDVADARSSFCTLSVEGLAESETVADNGTEPAPIGSTSSLRLLQPVAVTGTTLVSSTVPENDHAAWSSTTTYAKGARVILTSTHRIYESASAGNAGNNPSGTSGAWIDVAPTNRWAMFDEALGTSTLATGSLSVVLAGSSTTAIALVDVTGASVRVQASGYDRTQAAGAGAIVFADLPSVTGQITVTVTGSGAVAVGTLLIGRIVGLGITEASPTAGITDYSRKEVDDFGEVSVVQRAWAKRMSARALLRTEAVDQVASRIAAVRARSCLWIADSGLDAVTVYGFFKEFSIEVGERVSKLTLSVEGLSKAAPVATAAPDAGGLTPRGVYDPATIYSEGDVVQYDGSSWYFISETPASGKAPPLLPATENAYWRVFARAGRNGEDAPLVLVQWSVDGMTGWHANYADGDLYQRQSNDNGVTWGPAVRVVGEGASAGADGISTFIIFRRLATVPATPQQDTGNPPPGWFDAPPAGADLLWQSVSKFRGGTQLEPWSTPVRISGPAGASAFTLIGNTGLALFIEPTQVTKVANSEEWQAEAVFRTAETFASGCQLSFFPGADSGPYFDFGLWSSDRADLNGTGGIHADWTWHVVPLGNANDLQLYNRDTLKGTFGKVAGQLLGLTYDNQFVVATVNGAEVARFDIGTGKSFYARGAIRGNDRPISRITWAKAGARGESAPLVRVQWSVDGMTNWHDNYMGADVYQRQSNDNGTTWGPAYRVIGEIGDGPSIVFKRSATIPATPADNTGNPPTGWSDGPPAGTDYLWQSKATFKGSTQLTSWSAPARISGEDGVSPIAVTLQPNAVTFQAYANGSPYAGQFPYTVGVSATRAGTLVPVTSVAIVSTNGMTVATGPLRITGMSSSDAYAVLDVTAAGQTVRVQLSASLVREGSDGSVATRLAINAPQLTWTDFAQHGNAIAINASASGKLSVNLSGQMTGDPAADYVLRFVSKLQYRPAGGSWIDVPGSQATSTEGGLSSVGDGTGTRIVRANVNGTGPYAITGLTADAPYEVRAMTYRTTSFGSSSVGLSLYGERVA